MMRYHQDITSGVWTRLVEKNGRFNRFVISALILWRIRGRCDIELSLYIIHIALLHEELISSGKCIEDLMIQISYKQHSINAV